MALVCVKVVTMVNHVLMFVHMENGVKIVFSPANVVHMVTVIHSMGNVPAHLVSRETTVNKFVLKISFMDKTVLRDVTVQEVTVTQLLVDVIVNLVPRGTIVNRDVDPPILEFSVLRSVDARMGLFVML